MTSEQFLSLLRTVLKFGGSALVTHGAIDGGAMETVTGVITGIAPVVWDMFVHSDSGITKAADAVVVKRATNG